MEKLYKALPEAPGVYLMKDGKGRLLYVGKAGNLRRRVSSYFLLARRLVRRNLGEGGSFSKGGRLDARIQKLVNEIKKIDYRETDTALEALILEAELIKKLAPPYNVREKDDKSFLYVEITKEKFPRVLLVRGRDVSNGKRLALSRGEVFGPFTSASSVREALRILRRIFPWSTHPSTALGTSPLTTLGTGPSTTLGTGDLAKSKKSARVYHERGQRVYPEPGRRACFDYEVGLCPGTCIGAITREEYAKNIKNLILLFEGKKKKILRNLEKDMAAASAALEFEKAEKLRRRTFALQHIRDIALINDSESQLSLVSGQKSYRIEGYDISNISGTSAVGSMVVFTNGVPDTHEYRKFRIKTIVGSNDVGMLREVLQRRFARLRQGFGGQARASGDQWPLPHLILIDGGGGQVNAARNVLREAGLKIPIIGIAKGPKRKRNDFIGILPQDVDKKILIRVRDEAHRFAIGYHKKLRGREFLGQSRKG